MFVLNEHDYDICKNIQLKEYVHFKQTGKISDSATFFFHEHLMPPNSYWYILPNTKNQGINSK